MVRQKPGFVNEPNRQESRQHAHEVGCEENAPYLPCSFLLSDAPLSRDGVADLICDTNTGCPSTKHNHTKVTQLHLRDVQAGKYGGEGYAPSSLDVIVETGNLWPPPIEESPCFSELASACTRSEGSLTILEAEVFKM